MSKEEKKRIKKQKLDEKALLNKKQAKYKKLNLFSGVLLGMFLTISGYLMYNLYKLTGIETFIRYSLMGLIILGSIYLIIKYLKLRRRPLLSKYIIFIVLLLIIGSIEYFVGFTINKGLNVVDSISAQKYKTYSTSLITLKNGKLKDVKDITSSTKIGRIDNKDDIEGYKLTKEIIKKDKIKNSQIDDYEDTITMLYDLYDGKIDAIFISSSYQDLYSSIDKFEHITDETIELDKYSKKMKIQKEELSTSAKPITEPFTMLLMGVDSTQENLSSSSGLGDSLMLITFNPKTLNATILSIPRDTFVPISCYRNANSKITHAASGGDKCMINTIQNFFDVNIDYYAKINFRGLIKLVDALGGVDVDVPYAFCETDENRMLKNTVFVEKGMQHLNGVQALALSRNRKTYPTCGKKWNKGERNDFVRGQNQQLVINAIINKAKSMKSISQFYNLLDAVGGSMTTNMERKQILSFYNLFKNILINSKDLTNGNDIISMQKLYLNGSGGSIKDGIMNMNLYEYVPSTQSLNAIKNAMKVNLELKNEEPAKKFSFSSDEEYEQKVIGKNLSGGIKTYERASDTTTSSCGTNEELGADKKTCVCKWGYTRNNSGTCQKEEKKESTQTVTCGTNEELGADKKTCLCKPGYTRKNGVCEEEVQKKNECLSDGSYYYMYTDDVKGSTAYTDSNCSTPYVENSYPYKGE